MTQPKRLFCQSNIRIKKGNIKTNTKSIHWQIIDTSIKGAQNKKRKKERKLSDWEKKVRKRNGKKKRKAAK
jgi:hypothetical protein